MRQQYKSITEDLFQLHDAMRRRWPSLLRVAIALYDEHTELLHTFIKSSPDASLLNHYSVKLDSVPSLLILAQSGEARIIQDLSILSKHDTVHSQSISRYFKSSYTEPFYIGGKLLGFIFFDASEINYFDQDLLEQIHTYSRLIESLIVSEVQPIRALIGMVDTAKELTNLRDSETGKHLIRMARYMELIAQEIADTHGLSDEDVEYICYFAPLHDLGKIAIPDSILLKAGRLDDDEFAVMKTHVVEGLKMVDRMVQHFGFEQIHHITLLKEIIADHHERYDGMGYPNGKQGTEISIGGRIAAVADVFDALSTDRVYRKAMPVQEVFTYLQQESGKQFDPQCVAALLKNKDQVLVIMESFKD